MHTVTGSATSDDSFWHLILYSPMTEIIDLLFLKYLMISMNKFQIKIYRGGGKIDIETIRKLVSKDTGFP